MELIDNINKTLKDDLVENITKDSKLSIAAACFSIYAYQELKSQLESVSELRFIFTSPTFITEKAKKEKREFYIPQVTREKSLYGTEFEVKLRNELTQKAIAKECANWIKEKVQFKSNITNENMPGFIHMNSNDEQATYSIINGFTTVDLGCEQGNNAYYPVQKTFDYENSYFFIRTFNELWNDTSKLQDVTDIVLDNITTAYNENSPDFLYFVTLIIYLMNFLKIFQKMFYLMKLLALKKAKSGIFYIIFRKMLHLQLSINLNSIMDVFLLIVLDLERHLLH